MSQKLVSTQEELENMRVLRNERTVACNEVYRSKLDLMNLLGKIKLENQKLAHRCTDYETAAKKNERDVIAERELLSKELAASLETVSMLRIRVADLETAQDGYKSSEVQAVISQQATAICPGAASDTTESDDVPPRYKHHQISLELLEFNSKLNENLFSLTSQSAALLRNVKSAERILRPQEKVNMKWIVEDSRNLFNLLSRNLAVVTSMIVDDVKTKSKDELMEIVVLLRTHNRDLKSKMETFVT